MDERQRARYQARARIVKALAHPTRLFIADQISKRERCVCELRDLIGVDISTVSKHLGVLKNAGIVSDEKRGLLVYYRLRLPYAARLVECIDAVARAAAQAHARALEG